MSNIVIVGAGSAGCVLAKRLSEDGAHSVLLLEAGPDYGVSVGDWPKDIVNANVRVASHDWGYRSDVSEDELSVALFRGKIVGGSSATNSVIALRGHPTDYDEWAALGSGDWAFHKVAPFFNELEHDLDFSGSAHGTEGPVLIRRHSPDERSAVQDAFLRAAQTAGSAWVDDHNAWGAIGVGPLPENAVGRVRQSTTFAYLAHARARANFTVRANVLVDRVEFKDSRACAVRLAGTGERIEADEVILAAGVFGSPAILLRSGLGPRAALERLGREVVCDLSGVGENLQDHPLLSVRYLTDEPAARPGTLRQAMLTARSTLWQTTPDLQIFPSGPLVENGKTILKLLVGLMQPLARGRVTLRSLDPEVPPSIHPCLLRHVSDRARIFSGLSHARRIASTPPLDGLLRDEQWPGARVKNEADLLAAIRDNPDGLASYQHGCGTCRMGPADDRGAVVDGWGRVRGVAQLRVVDASIMPSIPSVNTNIPTIMLSERIAFEMTGLRLQS